MKYTVGNYVIVPEKPFTSMDKAVQYITGQYPELTKETIEKYLNPSIENNVEDQSGNIPEARAAIEENDAKVGSKSPDRVKTGKN